MSSDTRDWLREHWLQRRERILGELRGLDAGLKALPVSSQGDEVRDIIEATVADLRTKLEEVEGYLGTQS